MTRKYDKIYRLEETKVAGPSGPRISTGPAGRSLFCLTGHGLSPYASSGSLSTYIDTDRIRKGMRLKGEFAVVPTDKIEGGAYHKIFPLM